LLSQQPIGIGGEMSLGGTGSRDWLVQRFTAVFLAIYTLTLFIFILRHPDFNYGEWLLLFSHPVMQLATLFALLSIAFHAWIGLWTVLTDYVKPLFVRYVLEALIILVLFVYVVWGIFILWGN
jgi:succinate dehydrogenase / fumarate reductase membrane anchor subunit